MSGSWFCNICATSRPVNSPSSSISRKTRSKASLLCSMASPELKAWSWRITPVCCFWISCNRAKTKISQKRGNYRWNSVIGQTAVYWAVFLRYREKCVSAGNWLWFNYARLLFLDFLYQFLANDRIVFANSNEHLYVNKEAQYVKLSRENLQKIVVWKTEQKQKYRKKGEIIAEILLLANLKDIMRGTILRHAASKFFLKKLCIQRF